MKKVFFLVFSVVICGVALARPTYEFKSGWDGNENNDQHHPVTNQPYTEAQLKQFLEGKKDRNAIELSARVLAVCGVVEIQKGCHQANDRHVTIRADPRMTSNKVSACQTINTGGGLHVNGC